MLHVHLRQRGVLMRWKRMVLRVGCLHVRLRLILILIGSSDVAHRILAVW